MGTPLRPTGLDAVARFARELDTEPLVCRSGGHVWAPLSSSVTRIDGHIHWMTECDVCETGRTVVYTPDGYIVRRSYRYPDGYRREGVGRIDQHGRAMLRREMFRRFTED